MILEKTNDNLLLEIFEILNCQNGGGWRPVLELICNCPVPWLECSPTLFKYAEHPSLGQVKNQKIDLSYQRLKSWAKKKNRLM